MKFRPVLLGVLLFALPCLAQNPNWVQVQTKNSPPARWSHATAYDAHRGRTIVFGGTTPNTSFGNDTWEYDGTNWTQIIPRTRPPARRLASMAYHRVVRWALMFGGLGNGNVHYNDTWYWTGTSWRNASPTNSPSGRYNAALAYDSARAVTVLFGGRGATAYLNDTWEWNGSNWKRITTKNAPSPRYTNMVYDATRRRVVAFGGFGSNGAVDDTWEYDGNDWVKMNPTTQPSARCCVALAFDSARHRTVMFGGWSGYFQETWEYDGTNWTRAQPSTQPPGRYDFDQMVYDSQRNRMVLFGGLLRTGTPRQASDTWEYLVVAPAGGAVAPNGWDYRMGNQAPNALTSAPAFRLLWVLKNDHYVKAGVPKIIHGFRLRRGNLINKMPGHTKPVTVKVGHTDQLGQTLKNMNNSAVMPLNSVYSTQYTAIEVMKSSNTQFLQQNRLVGAEQNNAAEFTTTFTFQKPFTIDPKAPALLIDITVLQNPSNQWIFDTAGNYGAGGLRRVGQSSAPWDGADNASQPKSNKPYKGMFTGNVNGAQPGGFFNIQCNTWIGEGKNSQGHLIPLKGSAVPNGLVAFGTLLPKPIDLGQGLILYVNPIALFPTRPESKPSSPQGSYAAAISFGVRFPNNSSLVGLEIASQFMAEHNNTKKTGLSPAFVFTIGAGQKAPQTWAMLFSDKQSSSWDANKATARPQQDAPVIEFFGK